MAKRVGKKLIERKMEVRQPTNEEFEQVKIAANRMKLDTTNVRQEQFVCAFSDCGLAGFVRINAVDDFKELATLGVLKEYRKNGVGEFLVKNLQSNYSELHLVTVIPKYFKQFGFEPMSNVPDELMKKFDNAALWHGYGNPVVMKWEKS